MADVDFLSPLADQTMLAAHTEALSRADGKTGVVDGNRVIPSEPASLTVTVEAGRIRITGAPIDAEEDTVIADTADLTNPRIDIIYRDELGAVGIAKGTPAAIEDPKSLSNWKSYTSPSPPDAIPAGVILGALWIPAESTSISASQIWMFAGRVDDIATEVGTPGSDALSPSEKAVRTAIGTCAPSAQGVTNGNTHDHNGGDGAQIAHSNLSGIGTNTHSQIDSHVGSTSNPHSTTASQVGADITTSTLHAATEKATPADDDELGMIDSAASFILKKIKYSSLKTALKTYFDTVYILKTVLTTRGDIMVRDGTGPARLAKGSAGQRLVQGSDDPAWTTSPFTVPFTFGDGSMVVAESSQSVEIPIAAKITEVRVRSDDSASALVSGSATLTLYKHAYNAAPGDAVDSFALSSASSLEETGLNIAITAKQWISVNLTGITTCKKVTMSIYVEPT